jgi:hypothetical protein
MPIRPERRALYPRRWWWISLAVRARAKGCCEWPGCGAVNGGTNPATGCRIVLTVAHVWSSHPSDVRPTNLLALCQKHHLRLDAPIHRRNRWETLRNRKAMGDLLEPRSS